MAPSLGAAISLDGGKVHTRVAIVSPTSGQLSLVSFAGFIGHFSLVGCCIIGLIESAASLNYWPLGLIGVISLGLIASSASTASLACRLLSFVSLVGSLTHRLFRKRLTASVIEATNIGLNCLDRFDGIIGLAGFGLNCLDDFNGIIGLIGFGLIGCIGFIVECIHDKWWKFWKW